MYSEPLHLHQCTKKECSDYIAQVTFKDRKWTLLQDPSQCVSQVFCSAISVSYSGLSRKLWGPVAQLVLEGAYEATLLAGVINSLKTGNPRVLLTCLGGGVFGNELRWIADAIARAVLVVRRRLPGLQLEVVLVHYRSVDRQLEKYLSSKIA